MHPFLIFLAVVALMLVLIFWRRHVSLRRMEFIRTGPLPKGLFERLRKRRPALTQKDCELVAHALRQFFLAYAMGGRRYVSMPSQVVDDLWHEFILYTRNYQSFCRQAFGGFLHHTPAVVLGSERQANAGLRRCWWYSCRLENINPRHPSRLPLLFAIDAKLAVEDGFRYVPDCQSVRRAETNAAGTAIYCGGDFASTSFDGSTDGLGDSGGSPGDAGGGGDGCGGGGCGGD